MQIIVERFIHKMSDGTELRTIGFQIGLGRLWLSIGDIDIYLYNKKFWKCIKENFLNPMYGEDVIFAFPAIWELPSMEEILEFRG